MLKKTITYLFFINLFIILFFWWGGSSAFFSNGKTFVALGRLTGLLAEFLILAGLILISRLPFLEKVYGFDELNKIHRWIGYGLVTVIVSHPLFLLIGYSSANEISLFKQFINFITKWEDVSGAFFGIIILIVVGIISMPKIRWKLKYETWHFVHLFMYLAIGLVFSHQINSGDVSNGTALFYWFLINFVVFGVLIFYRFLRPIILFLRHEFYIEKVAQETHDVCSVYIGGKNLDKFKFESGQHLRILFLDKKMLQFHPFSFSSAYNGKFLRISIKNSGDFTSQIGNLKEGTKIIIDGPLGKFTELSAVKNKYLLIAGGIGITPIKAMIESLSEKGRDFIFIFGNKTEKDIVFKKELDKIPHHYVLSREKKNEYENGYIDGEKIQRIAPDFKERDIYICGPDLMLNSILDTLKNLGVDKSQIHYEKFYY